MAPSTSASAAAAAAASPVLAAQPATIPGLAAGRSALSAAAQSSSLVQQHRQLLIKQRSVELAVLVPASLWPIGEHVRELFPPFFEASAFAAASDAAAAATAGADASASDAAPDALTPIELFACLIDFVHSLLLAGPQAAGARAAGGLAMDIMPLLSVLFLHFHDRFLRDNHVHVVVRDVSPASARAAVVRIYYAALAVLLKNGLVARDEFLPRKPALLAAVEWGSVALFPVFGGQGNVEEYFEELVALHRTYDAFSRPLVSRAAVTLAKHSGSPEALALHATPINVLSWLERPDTRPSTDALLATHLSLPLIGLAQLVAYYVLLKTLDMTPGQLREHFVGTTGHSQGVVTAVAIAASNTEQEFFDNAQKALALLFWIGLRSQHASPSTTTNPNILEGSISNNEGVPTPMLAVTGMPRAEVRKHVEATNSFLPPDRRISLALINGPRAVICTGSPQSLYGLNVALRKLKVEPGVDQSRIPFSQRKIRFSSRFLPVLVPFHSDYLVDVPAQLEADIRAHGLDFDAKDLAIPVYNTHTGEDVRTAKSIAASLVEQICVQSVEWERATAHAGVTHIIDFGPGGPSGIGGLTYRNKEGTGVSVILANSYDVAGTELLDRAALYDFDQRSVRLAPNWGEKYRPRLVRIASTGEIHIDTPFSRLIAKPPIMVAGMTPCTANEGFVAAVINAGYHVELAGGGQHTEAYLRDRVDKIMALVPAGEGINLNILFLNPRLWGFQYPLSQTMRREGIPMEGICVAAGVPSLDVADEVCTNLKAAGLRYVAFKPGSVETIRRVVSIAKRHPDMAIVLQWTGGRGGGHHSFEDFHQPMFETYAAIRRVDNIILVVGSGFGDHSDTLPYLTGEWSTRFDYAPMPFDGILLGSRVMVAKENLASRGVKELIVAAQGIEDESMWERTYKGEIGGIITVKSELGEPIHKIANRGVLFWKEMDDLIFSLPLNKRLPVLLERKDYIIQKLNSDFQKPWFGRKADGRVCDLHEMTYGEVVDRLFETLYVAHQARWIDVTLRDVFGDFLRRVEERFSASTAPSLLQSYATLDHEPASFIEAFMETFPEAATQILTQEDVFYFLAICSNPVRKPVTFIPVLDDRFEFWFKKDSLWQSEDVDAVAGQDPQRVAILQGPVAVRHSRIVDEPVADILGNMYRGQIAAIKAKYYNDDDSLIPMVEYIGPVPRASAHAPRLSHVQVTESRDGLDRSVMLELPADPADLPPAEDYYEFLAGPETSWMRALLASDSIVQGKLLVDNPIRRILRPRPGQTVFVRHDDRRRPVILSVYDRRQVASQIPRRHPSVTIRRDETGVISVTLFEQRPHASIPLEFRFTYVPTQGRNPIHEIMEGRNDRVKKFYAALWSISDAEAALSPEDTFRSTFVVGEKRIYDFVHHIGNEAELYAKHGKDSSAVAPMDFAIVAGWRSLVTALQPKEIDGDLLRLVHLSNEFRMLDRSAMIEAGDCIYTEARIQSVLISDSGKTVEVKGVLHKMPAGADGEALPADAAAKGTPIVEITSRFLYRGKFTDFHNSFSKTTEKPVRLEIASSKDVAVLRSKPWIEWHAAAAADAPEATQLLKPHATLLFQLETVARFKNAKVYSRLECTGAVLLQTTRETVEIGRVKYAATDCHGHVVMEFLNRNGAPIEEAVYFASGGYSILPVSEHFAAEARVPSTNTGYAESSGDLNPIHVNPYFADLASLPGTITHGMWTSAATRKFVEIYAAGNEPKRVRDYSVTFNAMVLPGDLLQTKLSHVGMSNGKMMIKIETLNQHGATVLVGSALVEQAPTAYVFTGQGSQEVGMGMDLYKLSAVARAIWDRADKHFLDNYGLSIIEIVRDNPKAKTVHFGGIKGAKIRSSYMNMRYDTVDESGAPRQTAIFGSITEDTESFTFQHPAGLLSATQFTQPALTLTAVASFTDMEANGLVQTKAAFAGHSLGEYAALCAIGRVLSIESIVDITFYRGLTMQVAVPRDELGRSQYGMVAANPVRVSMTMGERGLRFIVDAIARCSKGLIEIVNFNVENFQYVVAGELVYLDTLRLVLNRLKALNLNFVELTRSKTVAEIEELLDEIVNEKVAESREAQRAAGGFITPQRGIATVPLTGIDVPFHSSFLNSGITPFRNILKSKFEMLTVNVDTLRGKYIPNLTARPFSTDRSYFEYVYELSKSTLIKAVLDDWEKHAEADPAVQQQRALTLLIELLAHQFASPVRWIETQDQLFRDFHVERLIEVGPSPVLAGMAARTLKIKYEAYDDAVTQKRMQLCTNKDRKEIYYDFEDAPAAEEAAPAASAPAAAPAAAAAAPVAAAAAPVAAAPAAAAGPVADEPISAKEVLFVMIAHKLKKPLEDVAPTKSIKDLVGGKSTLQNEILGDLAAEFGNVLADKAEELPLGEVATALQNSHSGSLGKASAGLVNKLVSSKMPGGFGMGQVKAHLSAAFGLGPKRTDGALLHGLVHEPAGRFGSDAEARAWLDKVAASYAAKVGVTLGSAAGGAGAGAGAAAAGPVVNSKDFVELKDKMNKLMRQQLSLYAKFVDLDLLDGARLAEAQKDANAALQLQLDLWSAEHGDAYAEGIRPSFDKLKARVFDSHWNWARQDVLQLYYDLVFGRITSVDRELMNQSLHIMNRTDDAEAVISFMEYYIETCDETKGENYARAKQLGRTLIENCRMALTADPVYKNFAYRPTRPVTTITDRGELKYTEERRAASNMKDYVAEMRQGSSLTKLPDSEPLVAQFTALRDLVKAAGGEKTAEFKTQMDAIFDSIRAHLPTPQFDQPNLPFLFIKRRSTADPTHWVPDAEMTRVYLDALADMARDGITFKSRSVLMTGCGKDSIGAEVLKALLSGGAQVVVTTSRFQKSSVEYFQSVYEQHGSKGSRLVVVPFNGGSQQDVNALVDYIYSRDPKSGLGWDLDAIIPFAAIPEQGREIDGIDSRSELAHRIMLTNLLRLLGQVKIKKAAFGFDTRPALVMLPLSPNHGTFGGDGLYSESKIALETLMNRFHAESWSGYLTIVGAVIGWTRGTGLMSGNNMVAEGIESLGARTFSQHEMAFNLSGLLHPAIVKRAYTEPIWADLNGGLHFVSELANITKELRRELLETAEIRRAVARETALDRQVLEGPTKAANVSVTPRANMRFAFPKLAKPSMSHLRGLLDLDKVIVVTGFGEVGPFGGSRTRWEMESFGKLSLEGCIELAWVMGMITFHRGPLGKIPNYSGWIDVETKQPVQDFEIKSKYESKILEHTGIRLIEPELFGGYDPNNKMFIQEVAITEDTAPIEVSREEAAAFKRYNGDAAIVEQRGEQWFVSFAKGASIFVPKSLRFDRFVAGQIPKGWSAKRYGVPDDIISQVDPITLYTLVATVEALVSSGVTDPYEFYKYVHVSELGNTSGGGMGGMLAMRKIFRRYAELPSSKDILQESFINTMPAWINMLLLSSSGPIKTPVGACATAAESVEVAVDTLLSGKARVVICGGYDDFQEESSYEFANMKATSSSDAEFAMGREPREMCRPASDTRGGFMEAHGSGIAVLMTATLALQMGVPIRGIVASTSTATDKNSRSVPAPGQGVLTTARETPAGKHAYAMLDIKYRTRQLRREREFIKRWVEDELADMRDELEAARAAGTLKDEDAFVKERTALIEQEAVRKEKNALSTWSHDWWRNNPHVSPLRAGLATFGLTIDDIGVASFHGTGTKANDYNESSVVSQQMEHLGRTVGNILPAVFQKHLTGHPKGAAAAWMLNGALQILETGIVPGNRNLDNVEARLRKFKHIIYPSRSIQTDGIKSVLLKSFGFGQAGAEILVVHPDYLFAAVDEAVFDEYAAKREKRQIASYRYYHEMLTSTAPLVRVKDAAPYTDAQQSSVYLNPLARATYDAKTGSYNFNNAAARAGKTTVAPADVAVTKALVAEAAEKLKAEHGAARGIGVDVQLVAEVAADNDAFVARNFTDAEIAYCRASASPAASFAGRWAAKEAVIKAVSSRAEGEVVWTKGAGAPLNEIEIVREDGQAPRVVLHGEAKAAADAAGVADLRVTISHSGSYAVAMAVAQ
ncbi:fatty acid synthase alpha subunit Lsd1 [Polyrhizophydium stewartii]|uniref:Fatty acid synthase alpha subunit Lsd1 n=1 Tax=Polyrhizophydium stewartii TaxID=2732419 RepID=A0ABR4N2M8_9FUNG